MDSCNAGKAICKGKLTRKEGGIGLAPGEGPTTKKSPKRKENQGDEEKTKERERNGEPLKSLAPVVVGGYVG